MAERRPKLTLAVAPDLEAAVARWQAWLSEERRAASHTVKAYQSDIAQFLNFLCLHRGGTIALVDLADLTPTEVRAWLAERVRRNIKASSNSRALSVLRSFFRWLQRNGLLENTALSAIRGPKTPKALPRALSDREAKAVVNEVASLTDEDWQGLRDTAVLLLLYGAGLRIGEALGLTPVPATQVVARDRHAEFLYACSSVAATCELMAVELRHLQRTEVREVQEGFKPGQKGSSAMPHKRNPISAETISGLARVLRSNLSAGLQDVALWHERDISHSSVERIILPDSSQLAFYVMKRLRRLLDGLVIFPARMQENLDASFGLVFSQPVLLALVQAGATRDDAYRIVQRNAMQVWEHGGDFLSLLKDDAQVIQAIPESDLVALFDLGYHVKHVDEIFRRVFGTGN